MKFNVLGPLEAVADGIDVTPTAAMPRRVLATLLVHAGRVVPIPTLIEELWGGTPPRLARKTVQTYLHQLRKTLAAAGADTGRPPLLETRPEGYRITPQPGELDLALFRDELRQGRALLARGDLAQAAGTIRGALDRWHGEALAGLQHGPVLAAQAAWLEDLRLGALEQRIEAELRLGKHREVLGELAMLTNRHLTHEQFCVQFMLAAYRSGRRADALAAYGRLRRAAVDLTGLEPSERLQRLHQAVLAGAPALALPAAPEPPAATAALSTAALSTTGTATAGATAVSGPALGGRATRAAVRPAELPPPAPDFVGRRAELASLTEALSSRGGRTGGRRAAVILGGVGAGKTALALKAGAVLREDFPGGQLFATLHTAQEQPVLPLQVLHGFLRALGATRLPLSLDESARLYRSLTADLRVLVVLDDAASTEQVLPLLPGGGSGAALITARERLGGLPGAAVVRPGPFSTAEGIELLATGVGAVRVSGEREAAEALVGICSHLPLAVRAVGERLAAEPALRLAELTDRLRQEDARIPELRLGGLDMSGRLTGAYRRLEPAGRDALRKLGRTGGAGVGPEAVAELLGTSPRHARQLVDGLVGAHLVESVPSADGEARLRVPDLIRLVGPASAGCQYGSAGQARHDHRPARRPVRPHR